MARRRFAVPLRTLARHPWQAVLIIALLLAVALLRDGPPWSNAPPAPRQLPSGIYRVERVVDGDTLVLQNGQRVRLIGADTPETVKPNHPVEPWGPQATQFTRRFVAAGEVRLQFDGPRRDKYDRLLAHVWVDDRELGESLVRAGLARATTHYRFSQTAKARLRAAESEARGAGRGIWSHAAPP